MPHEKKEKKEKGLKKGHGVAHAYGRKGREAEAQEEEKKAS